MSKKVLHVFGIMNRGGAELRTLSTLERMRNLGVEYEFLVLSGHKGVLDQEITERGSKVHYCPLSLTFFFQFMSILKAGKYDVVHSHVSLVSGVILFISWLGGIKRRVAHFRSTHDVENPSALRRIRDKLLRRLLLTFSHYIAGVCEATLDAFWHFDWRVDSRFKVIYNGFEQDNVAYQEGFWQGYLGVSAVSKIIINVSRMHEQKNHPRLIEIFCEYCQKNNDAVLILIGKEDPEIKPQLQRIGTLNNADKRIFYLGEKAQVLPFIKHADMMLFPSKWEGLPGAVLEAASLGVPVLASDIPGVLEIAQQLDVVHHFPLARSDKNWALQITQLLSQPVEHEVGRQTFKSSVFQLDHNVKQLYALYA